MSVSLYLEGYSDKNNKEFQKHYNAVKFCIENELSYPKETSEFFRGRIDGDDLEDFEPRYILEKIEEGLPIELNTIENDWYTEVRLKVSDIPKEVDIIIAKIQ